MGNCQRPRPVLLPPVVGLRGGGAGAWVRKGQQSGHPGGKACFLWLDKQGLKWCRGGSFRAVASTLDSWRLSTLQGGPGSCTHRVVLHSLHQVPGLGGHVPRRGREGNLERAEKQRLKPWDSGLVRQVLQEEKCYINLTPSECIQRLSILKKSQPSTNQRCAPDLGATWIWTLPGANLCPATASCRPGPPWPRGWDLALIIPFP